MNIFAYQKIVCESTLTIRRVKHKKVVLQWVVSPGVRQDLNHTLMLKLTQLKQLFLPKIASFGIPQRMHFSRAMYLLKTRIVWAPTQWPPVLNPKPLENIPRLWVTKLLPVETIQPQLVILLWLMA